MTDENQATAEIYARKKQIRRALQRLDLMRKEHENPYMAPEVYRERMSLAMFDLESILSRGMPPQ